MKCLIQTSPFTPNLSDPRDPFGIRNPGSIKQSNGMEELGHWSICSLGCSKHPQVCWIWLSDLCCIEGILRRYGAARVASFYHLLQWASFLARGTMRSRQCALPAGTDPEGHGCCHVCWWPVWHWDRHSSAATEWSFLPAATGLWTALLPNRQFSFILGCY